MASKGECGKGRYANEELAARAARHSESERGDVLRVYECDACTFWHMTSNRYSPTQVKILGALSDSGGMKAREVAAVLGIDTYSAGDEMVRLRRMGEVSITRCRTWVINRGLRELPR